MFRNLVLIALISIALPTLSKELKFKSLEDLDKCSRDNSYDTGVCYEPLKVYVKSHPKDAFSIAKKARRVFASWVSIEWFNLAITKNKETKVCADPEFQIAFLNAFGQGETDPPYLTAKKLLEGPCMKDLVPVVMKEMDEQHSTYFEAAVCPTVKKAGKTHVGCDPKKPEVVVAPVEEKLPSVDKNKLQVASIVKVFKGPEGSRISMVKVTGDQGLYLIKIEGVDSPWNNKVLLHKEDSANVNTADYWTENEGKKWNTISKRNCYNGFCSYEVFLPGKQGALSFSYDEAESKKIKSSEILKSF